MSGSGELTQIEDIMLLVSWIYTLMNAGSWICAPDVIVVLQVGFLIRHLKSNHFHTVQTLSWQ